MSLIVYKVVAAGLIFLISLVTVIYPLRKRSALQHPESVELGEALASGIFLGAAFFHMLPEAITSFSRLHGIDNRYPIPEFICIGGFLLLLFLERLSFIRCTTHQSRHAVPYILVIILTIHAVIEGAALGIMTTLSGTVMLLIAIIAHKGSESFALCVTLIRHALPIRHVITIIAIFSLMTPFGIGIGALINRYAYIGNGELAEAIFNAFAAGTFLYISTLHHVRFHQHTEETQGLQEFACLLSGLVMMAATALIG